MRFFSEQKMQWPLRNPCRNVQLSTPLNTAQFMDPLYSSENTSDDASVVSTSEESNYLIEKISWLQNEKVQWKSLNKSLSKSCYQENLKNNQLHWELSVKLGSTLKCQSAQQDAFIVKLEELLEKQKTPATHNQNDSQIYSPLTYASIWELPDSCEAIRVMFSAKNH